MNGSTITLSAFADEISPDLDVQMDVLKAHGIGWLDVRGIDSINVAKMTIPQAGEYSKRLSRRGFSVACLGSPIGKIRIDEDFPDHLELLAHCCDVAAAFETDKVRVFSFYPSPGRRICDQRQEVMDRLAEMVRLAESKGIILLHENEKQIYGCTPAGVKDIFATIRSNNLKGVFDPANFVEEGIAPFDQGWRAGLSRLTEYFHIKDKRPNEQHCVPAGQGMGQIDLLLADLKARNWSGFMSIEPHMSAAGQFDGFTGVELFSRAVESLKQMLDRAGLSYH